MYANITFPFHHQQLSQPNQPPKCLVHFWHSWWLVCHRNWTSFSIWQEKKFGLIRKVSSFSLFLILLCLDGLLDGAGVEEYLFINFKAPRFSFLLVLEGNPMPHPHVLISIFRRIYPTLEWDKMGLFEFVSCQIPIYSHCKIVINHGFGFRQNHR